MCTADCCQAYITALCGCNCVGRQTTSDRPFLQCKRVRKQSKACLCILHGQWAALNASCTHMTVPVYSSMQVEQPTVDNGVRHCAHCRRHLPLCQSTQNCQCGSTDCLHIYWVHPLAATSMSKLNAILRKNASCKAWYLLTFNCQCHNKP